MGSQSENVQKAICGRIEAAIGVENANGDGSRKKRAAASARTSVKLSNADSEMDACKRPKQMPAPTKIRFIGGIIKRS